MLRLITFCLIVDSVACVTGWGGRRECVYVTVTGRVATFQTTRDSDFSSRAGKRFIDMFNAMVRNGDGVLKKRATSPLPSPHQLGYLGERCKLPSRVQAGFLAF